MRFHLQLMRRRGGICCKYRRSDSACAVAAFALPLPSRVNRRSGEHCPPQACMANTARRCGYAPNGLKCERQPVQWIHQNGRQPLFLFPVSSSRTHSRKSLTLSCNPVCYSSATSDKAGFAGLTPREQGKLLSRFLFQWIHQNRRQPLFLFPVPCSLFPVPCSLALNTLSCNLKRRCGTAAPQSERCQFVSTMI